MKKLLFLATCTAIVFSLNACSDRDENITPKESAMKMEANLNKQAKVNSITKESSTPTLTPPTHSDNQDETIDPTKPDRPR